jgi:iron complex outermembrane recepter protein
LGRVVPSVTNSGRARGRRSASRVLLSVIVIAAVLAAAMPIVAPPAAAQTETRPTGSSLPPIRVSAPRKRAKPPPAYRGRTGPAAPATAPSARSAPAGGGGAAGGGSSGGPPTPLNGNAIAASASLLGLPAREVPATVGVVSRETIREQGYRTTTETVPSASGVLAGDAAGAPAGFSMRGFTFGAVNVLYNGISIGPQSITSRWMDTSNLAQVEFLKGPSSLMSGLNAIGGSVNFVNIQPTAGPIRHEMDFSLDSLGSIRTHYGSGGTAAPGIDYRFDVSGFHLNGFIEDVYRNIGTLSTQVNYRLSDWFKTFVAVEYKQDSGRAYWGTPLVPIAFAGRFAVNGVVSGTAINTFDGTNLGPLTVGGRTLTTNYNVADNSTGARELWLRSGFEWSPNNGLTIKDQVYYYQAQRHWIDSETYAFNLTTSMIDRDRFFVTHDQSVMGNILDLLWKSQPFGMDNRFAAQLLTSTNRTVFGQEGNPNAYPFDSVTVVDPIPGFYGSMFPNIRNSRLDTVAATFEDRLKLTPAFGLIGGVRFDDFTLTRDGVNFDGSIPNGLPFSQTWRPVAYRAAATYEPIRDLMFYGMYATAYDPAAAGIFSVSPATTLALTSARIYETGIKQLLWDNKAEWTLSLYDIDRRNVYVQTSTTTFSLAGEVATKGVEFAAAVRPIEGLKLWGNLAFVRARYENFTFATGSWTGNTPSNVAPVIVNAGVNYRYAYWRWPVEIGGSVRHVGNRYLFEDDATIMNAYTTADVYASVDVRGRDFGRNELDYLRLGVRVRNLTNVIYAAWSDPGYPDQVYLGAPRTYELFASAKW